MGLIFNTSVLIGFERRYSDIATLIKRREQGPWEEARTHDLIIAATAVSLNFAGVTLNTRDVHKIKGVKVHKI